MAFIIGNIGLSDKRRAIAAECFFSGLSVPLPPPGGGFKPGRKMRSRIWFKDPIGLDLKATA
jgi:hypothetical protein